MAARNMVRDGRRILINRLRREIDGMFGDTFTTLTPDGEHSSSPVPWLDMRAGENGVLCTVIPKQAGPEMGRVNAEVH